MLLGHVERLLLMMRQSNWPLVQWLHRTRMPLFLIAVVLKLRELDRTQVVYVQFCFQTLLRHLEPSHRWPSQSRSAATLPIVQWVTNVELTPFLEGTILDARASEQSNKFRGLGFLICKSVLACLYLIINKASVWFAF